MVCIGVLTHLKTTTLSFLPSPAILNLQTALAPFLSNFLSLLVFCEPFLKVGLFSEPQKYQSFSSLTQSYLLKVTKFLVEISQFEFLVMTEKNIFVHKLFMPLNIQILIYFYVKIASLLNKVTPSFPANPL